MEIPQNEIDVVFSMCQEMWANLTNHGVVDDKTRPLTIISNPFPDFAWLLYHPSIAIGGSDAYFSQKGMFNCLYYDSVFKQLVWWNREVGTSAGWHPIKAQNDEVIEEAL